MQESSTSNAGSGPPPRGLRLHESDNVAVALATLQPGPLDLLGATDGGPLSLREPVAQGHKFALRSIAEGQAVVKCGVAIGFATVPIESGAWVHTHNCRSGVDERSHTLDPHSGAPTDTRYV